jgi:hypothetical protein
MGTPMAMVPADILGASESLANPMGASVGVGARLGWPGAASERVTWSSVNTTPKVSNPAVTITSPARIRSIV